MLKLFLPSAHGCAHHLHAFGIFGHVHIQADAVGQSAFEHPFDHFFNPRLVGGEVGFGGKRLGGECHSRQMMHRSLKHHAHRAAVKCADAIVVAMVDARKHQIRFAAAKQLVEGEFHAVGGRAWHLILGVAILFFQLQRAQRIEECDGASFATLLHGRSHSHHIAVFASHFYKSLNTVERESVVVAD